MKVKLLLLAILVLAFAAPVFAQYGTMDTLIVLTNRPEAGANDTLFTVELWLWNDEAVGGVQGGFNWTSADVVADTAFFSPVASSAFTLLKLLWESDSIAVSNRNHRFMIAGVGIGGTIAANAARQLVATWQFTVSNWTTASQVEVDTGAWDAGTEFQVLTSGGDLIPFVLIPNQPIIVQDPSDANSGRDDNLPVTYGLSQNYPNPFNPATTINFTMPVAGDYELTIYNVIGQVVREYQDRGVAGLNTVTWDASQNASGIYFYKLKAGDFTETKKMALVK